MPSLTSCDELSFLLQAGAKDSFVLFCYWMDSELFSARPYLKSLASDMQWLYDEYKAGRPRRLGISLPPRAGKSYLTSLFCAWWLGKLPEQGVMRNTATARLYQKFSYDVRDIVKSDKYRAIFPSISLAPDKQNIDGWKLTTSKQVAYFGAGVGGSIIGFGANLAITDDLYRSIEDALSENYNDGVHRWKESAHDSRKELNCPEIYIGTRWSKKDVIGKALEEGRIDRYTRVPALTEDDKSFCEAVKTTAEYLETRDSMDETIWMAEFQQEPMEIKGTLFAKDTLKFYDPAIHQLKSSDAEFIFVAADAADEGGDFYAAPVCYLIGKSIYIPEVIFSTDGIEATEPATLAMAANHGANAMEFEGNGGWVSMGKSLRVGLTKVLPECTMRIIKNSTNKETRILAASAFIRNNIYFRSDYKGDRQYNAFMQNLTSYLKQGGNKHDDAPDVLAGVARYFQRNFQHLFPSNLSAEAAD